MAGLFDNFLKKVSKDLNEIVRENKEVVNNYNASNDINNVNNMNHNKVNSDRKSILNKLVAEDSTFSEAKFKSKVDNVFIKLYTGVMKQDLENIKHFMSDEVYQKYMRKINESKSKNEIQMYDELNVSNTNIDSVEEFEDRYEINVTLLTKYLDYRITKDTKKYISGDRNVRKEKNVSLKFSKIKNAKAQGNARTCPGCGANIDVNKNGVCEYCGCVYTLKNYDWVLEKIFD